MVGSHLISRIHIRCKKKKHREIANPKKSSTRRCAPNKNTGNNSAVRTDKQQPNIYVLMSLVGPVAIDLGCDGCQSLVQYSHHHSEQGHCNVGCGHCCWTLNHHRNWSGPMVHLLLHQMQIANLHLDRLFVGCFLQISIEQYNPQSCW